MSMNKMAYAATVKIVKAALLRYAKEDNNNIVEPHQVKIMIGTKCPNKNFNPNEPASEQNPDVDLENTEPYFFLLKKDELTTRPMKKGSTEIWDELTFENILNVDRDVLGRGWLAKKYLKSCLSRFAKELNTDPRNVKIGLTTPEGFTDNKGNLLIEPVALLFDDGLEGNPFVRQIDFENEVFAQDDKIDEEIVTQAP